MPDNFYHYVETCYDGGPRNNTTIKEMELLYPDGSIATVSKIPVVDRPWQVPDVLDVKRLHQNTPKPKDTTTAQHHLQFFTTIKMKTASKLKPKGGISSDVQSRQVQHTAPPKPWSRETPIRTANHILMSPYEFNDAKSARRTPFFHLDDAIEREQLEANMNASEIEAIASSKHIIEENLRLKSVYEDDNSKNKEDSDTIKKHEETDYNPARLALMDTGGKTLPKIPVLSKPISIVNIEAILDCQKQDAYLKSIFDNRLKRQIWCHGLDVQDGSPGGITETLFANIPLPKPKHGAKPPSPKILFSKLNPPVPIIHSGKSVSNGTLQPSNQVSNARPISHTCPILPSLNPASKSVIQTKCNRIQPPFPERVGPSIDVIMKDMNDALNNLFYYPHQGRKHNNQKVLEPEVRLLQKEKHCAKKPRYPHDEPSNSKLIAKARKEYEFTHLHKDDYAKPMNLPEIGITCGSSPKPLKNPHLMVCLGGFPIDDANTVDAKPPKSKAIIDKPYLGPGHFDPNSKLVMVGHKQQ
ncbi:hypothetical protein BDR26DRAFT_1005386 [Obelidium mucronatum]|nr:hypothetical protein BDR26DRAFT_1005386 [Obelidium mucronatum]